MSTLLVENNCNLLNSDRRAMVVRKAYGQMREEILLEPTSTQQFALPRLYLCLRHSIKVQVAWAVIVDQEALKCLSAKFNTFQQFIEGGNPMCTQLVTSFINEFPNGRHPMFQTDGQMSITDSTSSVPESKDEDIDMSETSPSDTGVKEHLNHLITKVTHNNHASMKRLHIVARFHNHTSTFQILRFVFDFGSGEVAVSEDV